MWSWWATAACPNGHKLQLLLLDGAPPFRQQLLQTTTHTISKMVMVGMVSTL